MNFNMVLGVDVVFELYEFTCIFILAVATLLSVYSGVHYLIKYKNVFGVKKQN